MNFGDIYRKNDNLYFYNGSNFTTENGGFVFDLQDAILDNSEETRKKFLENLSPSGKEILETFWATGTRP